ESFAEAAIRANRLVGVLIGVTATGRLEAVRSTVRAVRASGVTAPVLVGGAAVRDADHAMRLGADGWTGPDGRTALAAVERIVGDSPLARRDSSAAGHSRSTAATS